MITARFIKLPKWHIGQWYHQVRDGKPARIVTVTVFSLSLFGGLAVTMVRPPVAKALIELGDGLTVYGNSASSSTTPRYRDYFEVSDSFGSETNTVSGSTPLAMQIKTSPVKTEAIVGYQNSSGTLQIMCYDGTNWSNDWSVSSYGTGVTRAYDIAYEWQSGDVMVLYSTNTATTNELAFRRKAGGKACGSANWDSAVNVNPVRTSAIINWVTLQQDQNSNNMAAIWADSSRDLSAMIYDGTNNTWGNEPSAALSTDLGYVTSSTRTDTEDFDLAYESASSDLMVVWSNGGTSSGSTNLIKYITCTGGGTSCSWGSVSNVPTVSDAANHLDMAANPQTDQIVFGAIDSRNSDLSVAYWSGSAWTGTANVDTSCETATDGRKIVTANWLINGSTTKSIIMYGDSNSQRVDYVTGVAGTFTVQTDFTPSPLPTTTTRYYKSRKDPYHLNRVMLEFQDSNNDLFAKHVVMDASGVLTWSDSDGGAALQGNITSSRAGPFAFAYWQNVPTPGPSKISQDGYIFENDDQVAVGGNTADGDSVQDAGSTAITGVRQGERLTLRFHVRNTGVDPLTGSLGLFYDRNDGYFVKADDHVPPNTSAGNCTDTKYNCAVVDNAAGTTTGQWGSLAFDPSGQAWVAYYDTTNTRLMVAKYVGYGGSGCGASGSTAWTCSVVDSAAATDLGKSASLAFSRAGVPWVSYYDTTSTNLKVAVLHTDTTTSGSGCGTGSTMWDCTTVDSTANSTGTYNAIAFSAAGAAGVAYTYNTGTTAGIKYATYVGSGGTGCAVATWTCIVVDSGSATGIDYASIQYDHADDPWIAYYDKSATSLRVGTYVGGTNGTGCGTSGSTAWTCSTIDNTGTDVGSWPYLMFGPKGNPWVSYYDTTNTALRVATKSGSFGSQCTDITWTCDAVDNSGSVGQYTALAADASGKVLVSYYDSTNTSMRVARFVGGTSGNCTANSWDCGSVDNTGTDTGQYTSLAVAPDGNVWASYYDVTNTSLRAAQVTRGGEIIPAAGLAAVSPGSIATSQSDMTTVSDTTNKNDADCIDTNAAWNNGVWGSGSEAQSNQTSGTNSILPAGNVLGQCTEVAFTLDTSQATAGSTYRFIVAASNSDRPDKGWWRGPADITAYATLTMSSSSITQRFSKDTNPSFASCDGSSTWGCEIVDSTNSRGQYTGLAYDPAGRPWISYYDASATAMRVARYVGTGGTGCATTEWTCIQMENQAGRTTGQYSSIAFAKDGTPWVAYRDNSTSTGGLKVANRVSSSGTCASIGGSTSWNCTTIDNGTGGGTGQFTSVQVNANGTPWIAYYDNGNTILKVAQYVGSGGSGCTNQPSPAWSCFTVDSSGTAAFGTSAHLGFDKYGNAWISYNDSTNTRMRIAQYVGSGGSGCASTQWTCSQVDDGGSNFTSMAFNTSGQPYVSYYDDTNTALKVAQYVGSGGSGCTYSSAWTCTTVDNTASTGQYSSIAFSAQGVPWVSYYEASNGNLRIAEYVTSGGNCTSTAWNCSNVNTTNNVGQFSSLAFDHSGNPAIAYYDATSLDMKIAKRHMNSGKPKVVEVLPAGERSGRWDDGRYHLDNGLAPRSSTGDCSAVTNNMGYCGVANNDGFNDSLTVSPNERPFYIFALTRSDNTSPTFVQWRGASDVAASTATMTLEVFNLSTGAWESIGTNTSCAASSGCTLTGSPSGTLSNYYELSGSVYWIYFRVSQAPSTTGGLFMTNVFMFAPTTDLLMRHGAWFDPSSQTADRSQPYFWAD